MKIFSISHNTRGALTAALVMVATMVLGCLSQVSVPPPAAPNGLESRIVTSFQLKPEPRPQWARFSPVNTNLALIDLGGQGLLLSIPQGTTRRLDKELTPVGWLGETLIVRDQRGGLRLLDASDLTPAKNLSVGSLPLPWTFGKDRHLRFQLALPEMATTVTSPMPGTKIDKCLLTTREDQATVAIAADGGGRHIVDASGRVLFQGDKQIYGISRSPDGYKLLVYYGNTEYVLFNQLTRRTTPLPSTIHAWTWLPDSSTLLGEVSQSGQPGQENVISTDLYIYELAGARLVRLALPAPLRGVALKILDVSAQGHILMEAERVVPEPAYLGLTILEVLWP